MLNFDTKRSTKNERAERFAFSDTDFRKQLKWLINNPPEGSIEMLITPQMAQTMLGYNTRNRTLRDYSVRDYARLMSEGKWLETKNQIKFATNGVVNDGQHRLQAIIKSGIPTRMMVVFGEDPDAFAYTDVGLPRTAGDLYHTSDIKNSHVAASAVRFLEAYYRGSLGSTKAYSYLTKGELLKAYEDYPGLQDSIRAVGPLKKSGLLGGGVAAALHWICAQKSKKQADLFFKKIGEGIGFDGKSDPAYKLHRKLIAEAQSMRRVSRTMLAAYVVKAWNAHRSGKATIKMQWRGDKAPTEPFPKAQ